MLMEINSKTVLFKTKVQWDNGIIIGMASPYHYHFFSSSGIGTGLVKYHAKQRQNLSVINSNSFYTQLVLHTLELVLKRFKSVYRWNEHVLKHASNNIDYELDLGF